MNLPGSLKIDGSTIQLLQKPVVYIWTRGEQCLYIGASRYGLARVLAKHHVIGVKDHIQTTDIMYLYHVNENELDKLELRLMNELRPTYNAKNSFGSYY